MRRFLLPTALFLAASFAFVFAQIASDDDPVVIRVGTTEVTLSQLDQRFEIAIRSLVMQQGMELTDEVRAQLVAFKASFLDQRATEIALVDEAIGRGVVVDEAVIDARVEEILGNVGGEEALADLLEASGLGSIETLRDLLTESELIAGLYDLIEADVAITDDALRSAYVARREQFVTPERACARHILLETVEDADAVLADLEAGADFASLAVERSTGPSGPNGGDLGCFGRGRMVPPFEEAVFSATVDVPFGPVETDFGQHVILVTSKTAAEVAPFEQVAAVLREQLVGESVDRTVQTFLEYAGIVTYPELLPAAVPATPAP